MILALLGRLDGDDKALETALDAIENEGIVTVLHAGGAAWGAGGSACIRLLRERGVRCVQGERDKVLSRLERKRARLERELGEAYAEYERAHAALRSADIEWLGALPQELRLTIDGVQVLLCSGIPGDQGNYFGAETTPSRRERARESAEADIVASGGAAAFFAEVLGDCLLVNAPVLDIGGWARVSTEGGVLRAEAVGR
jgi:predicted phosphodiesterase